MNKIKYITAVLIALVGLGLQQTKADTFTSSLDFGNSGLPVLTGGEQFGTVTVTLLSSTEALITFTANTAGGFTFIDGSSAAVQLSSSVTPGSEVIVTDAQFKDFSSGQVDGFGVFNLTVDNLDGSGSPVSTISFTVTGTFSSAADVLTANLSGFDAAAHISVNGGLGGTGFAAEIGGAVVPDGGMTAMLLGLGLSGLGFVRRFVKR